VYTTVCLDDVPCEPSDFFPLSVIYQERFSAAGRTRYEYEIHPFLFPDSILLIACFFLVWSLILQFTIASVEVFLSEKER